MIVARGVAEIIALALNAIVLIVVTRAVGPEPFGLFAVAATIGQACLIVTNAGLNTLGAQLVANLESEPADTGRIWMHVVIGRSLLAALVVAIVAGVATVAIRDPLLRGFMYAVLVGLPFGALKSEWFLVARGEAHVVAMTRVLGAVATAIACIALISDGADAELLPLIFVVPLVTTGLAGPALVLGGRRIDAGRLERPRWRDLTQQMRAGRHYFVAEFSVFLYGNSDRLFLFAFAGAAAVGLYDAAYRLIQPFNAIAAVVGDSLYRPLAKALGQPSFTSIFRWWVDLMSVATIPVGFVTFAYGPWIVDIIYGPQFSGASTYLTVLGSVVTFGYMAGIVTIPFTAWNAARAYGQSVLAGGLANLALNFLLIPPLGGIGAALATIGGKVTVGASGYPTFRRLTGYPVGRDFGYYAIASGVSVSAGVLLGLVLPAQPPVQIAVTGLVYGAFALVRMGGVPGGRRRALAR